MPKTSPPPASARFRYGPLLAGILLVVLLVLLVVQLSKEIRRIPPWPSKPITSSNAFVVSTIDGDTIVLRLDADGKEAHVRLLGVDTPETKRPGTSVQCWGPEASDWMKAHALGKRVVALPDSSADNMDKYDRLLRVITIEGESLSLDEQLIQEGMGFAYPQFPFSQNARYVEDERVAREAKLGLWNPAACPEYQSKPSR